MAIRDRRITLLFAGIIFLGLTMGSAHASEVPKFAADQVDAWSLRYHVWAALHYGLGLLSVVLSAIAVAYKRASTEVKASLSIAAAVAAAVLTFLNPSLHAQAFHRAWTDLAYKVREYGVSPTANPRDLVEAIESGERTVREAGVF
jgi:hypothetical protein